jgi:hypothetical protein
VQVDHAGWGLEFADLGEQGGGAVRVWFVDVSPT